MSPAERRQLIRRLERPLSELLPAAVAPRIRWGWLGIMTSGTLVLIPWTVYLAFALPDDYLVHDWTALWVGFDLLLLVLLAATAIFGMLRRQVMLLTAFATGMLLICDAWFDLMTAGPNDFRVAELTAALGALPLAPDPEGAAAAAHPAVAASLAALSYSTDSASPCANSFRNPSSSRTGTP